MLITDSTSNANEESDVALTDEETVITVKDKSDEEQTNDEAEIKSRSSDKKWPNILVSDQCKDQYLHQSKIKIYVERA